MSFAAETCQTPNKLVLAETPKAAEFALFAATQNAITTVHATTGSVAPRSAVADEIATLALNLNAVIPHAATAAEIGQWLRDFCAQHAAEVDAAIHKRRQALSEPGDRLPLAAQSNAAATAMLSAASGLVTPARSRAKAALLHSTIRSDSDDEGMVTSRPIVASRQQVRRQSQRGGGTFAVRRRSTAPRLMSPSSSCATNCDHGAISPTPPSVTGAPQHVVVARLSPRASIDTRATPSIVIGPRSASVPTPAMPAAALSLPRVVNPMPLHAAAEPLQTSDSGVYKDTQLAHFHTDSPSESLAAPPSLPFPTHSCMQPQQHRAVTSLDRHGVAPTVTVTDSGDDDDDDAAALQQSPVMDAALRPPPLLQSHRSIGNRLMASLRDRHESSMREVDQSLSDDDATAALSVLQVKAQLADERYYTAEQLEHEAFRRRSHAINTMTACVSVVMIFFTANTVAARVGLGSERLAPGLVWAELALDCAYFIMVLGLNLLMPFEEGGHIEHDPWAITQRYLSRPSLALFDMVSNFPAMMVLAPLGLTTFDFARVNLLLREVKLPGLLERLEEQLPSWIHPSLVRLGWYLMYLLLIVTHLSTIFMLALRNESERDVEHWVELSLEHQLAHDPWFWYSRCWHDMLALVSEQHLLYPHTDLEHVIALLLVVVSLVTIAVIIASFEEIIVAEIEEGNILGKKVEETLQIFDLLHLPAGSEVATEILEYYANMWEINRKFDFRQVADDVLTELPRGLQDDIEFECNAQIIRRIPLFADVAENAAFVRLLAGELQQIVVMPGAPIVSKGEEGDCMFFLNRGVAAVMTEDGAQELCQLEAGAFFGEVTMLFGGQRDRDIIAKTLCVCAVMTDVQFERVVDVYPEALEGILEAGVRRLAGRATTAIGAAGEKPSDVPGFSVSRLPPHASSEVRTTDEDGFTTLLPTLHIVPAPQAPAPGPHQQRSSSLAPRLSVENAGVTKRGSGSQEMLRSMLAGKLRCQQKAYSQSAAQMAASAVVPMHFGAAADPNAGHSVGGRPTPSSLASNGCFTPDARASLTSRRHHSFHDQGTVVVAVAGSSVTGRARAHDIAEVGADLGGSFAAPGWLLPEDGLDEAMQRPRRESIAMSLATPYRRR